MRLVISSRKSCQRKPPGCVFGALRHGDRAKGETDRAEPLEPRFAGKIESARHGWRRRRLQDRQCGTAVSRQRIGFQRSHRYPDAFWSGGGIPAVNADFIEGKPDIFIGRFNPHDPGGNPNSADFTFQYRSRNGFASKLCGTEPGNHGGTRDNREKQPVPVAPHRNGQQSGKAKQQRHRPEFRFNRKAEIQRNPRAEEHRQPEPALSRRNNRVQVRYRCDDTCGASFDLGRNGCRLTPDIALTRRVYRKTPICVKPRAPFPSRNLMSRQS